MPRSASRSYMRRGSIAVARSRTFSHGDDQNASWPTRRRLRSATDIFSAFGTRWLANSHASTAASPPMRRNSSPMTGPYSSQWPSASMIGWPRRARTWVAFMASLRGLGCDGSYRRRCCARARPICCPLPMTPTVPAAALRRWTRAEYDRLIELGVFDSGERLELIDGFLVVREPQGARHAAAIRRVLATLGRALGEA